MTLDCAICNCVANYANSPESFQTASLTVLCNLVTLLNNLNETLTNATTQIMCTEAGDPLILLIAAQQSESGFTVATRVFDLQGSPSAVSPRLLVPCCCTVEPK